MESQPPTPLDISTLINLISENQRNTSTLTSLANELLAKHEVETPCNLNNAFTITCNNRDRVKNCEVVEHLAKHNINISIRKAIKMLVENGAKKWRSGSTRGLSGLIIKF